MEKITRGSYNVLADLGFEDADDLSTKVQLAVSINRIIEGRRLKQAEVVSLLGISQPKVSQLMNFKLDGFSVEKLMILLTSLNRDVEIRIRKTPRSRKEGRILVAAAR